MTDEELIDSIATVSTDVIRLQRKYRNRPLWVPSLLPETKATHDANWAEAGRRGLSRRLSG